MVFYYNQLPVMFHSLSEFIVTQTGQVILMTDIPFQVHASSLIGPNLFSWSFKKPSLVARSSTEPEYRNMDNETADLMWVQSLLSEIQIVTQSPLLLCDNPNEVLLSHNLVLHARTRHLELDIHFVREKVASKKLLVQHVPSSSQIAYALTKSLYPLHCIH